MNRLLILACSQRKNPAAGLLPALDRYDGPAFRVLRKYFREKGGDAPRVFILSAKYGLVPAARKIPDYDCRLSPEGAVRLRPKILRAARRVLSSRQWHTVGLCAGKDYQIALDGFLDLVPNGVRVEVLKGGLGPRLTALRDWLHQSA